MDNEQTLSELSTSQTTGEGENAPSTAQAPIAAPVLTGKRANWTIAHKVDMEASSITWSVKGAGELKLDLTQVHAANSKRAMMHGFVQRVSDAAAMARDSKTGASATPQQKFDAMSRLVTHYASGAEEWSPARSTEGVGRPRVSAQAQLLTMALLIHAPEKGAETIEKFVKERNAAQITALLMLEELKEAVELAREELREQEAKVAEGVDAQELLSGL